MRQKQVRASLDDEDIARLEAAAAKRGVSLSNEIRLRLVWSFEAESVRADTRRLHDEIDDMIEFIEANCGRQWQTHPAAMRVLRHAITARLARYGARDDSTFAPDELPADRLVASDDPTTIGIGIEAMAASPPYRREDVDPLDLIAMDQQMRTHRFGGLEGEDDE